MNGLPGFAAGLHVISNDHVVWPDIILPLVKSHHSGQHEARMYAYTHVYLHTRSLTHVPDTTTHNTVLPVTLHKWTHRHGQHEARMYAYTHVYLNTGRLTHVPDTCQTN